MPDKSIYVVMRKSGAMMTMKDGLSLAGRTESEGPYLHILGVIATEHQSAGSNYDPPEKLFLNGKIVVERGLADLAWKFRQDEVAARDAAARAVKNMHMPDWLPGDEQKPGYNPPDIDAWTVTKNKQRSVFNDARVDLHTHYSAWSKAISIAEEHAEVSPPDIDDKSYWQHEQDALDRVCNALAIR